MKRKALIMAISALASPLFAANNEQLQREIQRLQEQTKQLQVQLNNLQKQIVAHPVHETKTGIKTYNCYFACARPCTTCSCTCKTLPAC